MDKLKLFLIFFAIILAQNTNGQDDYQAVFSTADSLYGIDEIEKALISYHTAYDIAVSEKNWENAITSLIEISYCTYELEKSISEKGDISDRISFILKQDSIDYSNVAKFYLAQSYNSRMAEDYNISLKHLERAISIYEEINYNHYNVAYAYKNAAQIYLQRLDYEKTLNYLEKGLASDSTNELAPAIYIQIANYYTITNDPENTLKYCQLGLAIAKKDADKANGESISAGVYIERGELTKAIELLNSSTNYYSSNSNYYWEKLVVNYLYYAITYQMKGNKKKEESYYLKAIKTINEYSSIKSRDKARLFSLTGDFYLNNGQIDKALSFYQKAIIQVYPNFNEEDISHNPKIEESYPESWAMTSTARKGGALLLKYKSSKNLDHLKNAAACYDLSIECIQQLKETYGTDLAKIYLGEFGHSKFEEIIQVNYLLHQATNAPRYLEKIFSIMERSKASVLTEGIQKNRGLILAGIPDSLLEAEQDIRLDLAELNKRMKTEELYEADTDEERLSALRQRTLARQREHEALLASLEEKYPQYKSFTEKPITPRLAELQAFLAERGETLLEYFVGEKNIYLMRIGPSEASIHQIPHNDFWDSLVGDFQDYFRNSTAILNDPQGYFETAATLYHQLFPFGSLPANLIVVPDGDLNFIPFDALVSEQPAKPVFTQAGFLLHRHRIRYAYSAGLLLAPPPRMEQANLFLRIAPLFANGERNLSPLANGHEKIDAIPRLQTLEGGAATLAAFQKLAPNCKLIQLSTHAGADSSGFAPRIEFIDEPLYLPELYAMHIPAELVVLSACETGLGEFEKGEGVMSLARGFAYSGTGGLVASLWKVNEGSTSAIFHHFYTSLATGTTKSEALRTAKLKYLEEAKSDAKTSPYYWASFISIGIDSPMELDQTSNLRWVLFAAVGIVLILIIIKLRMKN